MPKAKSLGTIKFEEVSSRKKLPPAEGRFTIGEHQTIEAAFKKYNASPARPPCKRRVIVACYATEDGVHCYTSCVQR